MKLPRRVYATPESRNKHPEVWAFWQSQINKHSARVLANGENPEDYPQQAVAFETLNFGWIMSLPNSEGVRTILLKW